MSKPTSGFELGALQAAVRRAHAEQNAPLKPEERSRPYKPLDRFFSDEDWILIRQGASAVRREYPTVFRLFASERTLMPVMVRLVVEAGDDDLPFEDLVAQLKAHAASKGPWLVGTPLANVTLAEAFVPINERTALVRPIQEHDWSPWEDSDDSSMEIYRHFEDGMSSRPRWLQANSLLLADLDTRHGAVLLTVEDGTAEVALDIGRTRARYALAVWTALRGPGRSEIFPSVGYWAPQPYIDVGQLIKEHHPGHFSSKGRTESRRIHTAEYALPEDITELSLPFKMMDAAPKHHAARALLSSAWAFHCAMRFPSEVEMTDRLFGIYTAVAALCEQEGIFDDKAVLKRWRAVRDHFDVWEELTRTGASRDDLVAAERRLGDIRNIAAHGADSVLVNLGYPTERTRLFRGGREHAGDYLAPSLLYSELHPLQWSTRRVLQHLLPAMSKADYDDEAFERCFVRRNP